MSAMITRERPDTFDAISLITDLEALLEPLYPSESRHGFSVDKLLAEDVAFFLLRANKTPACCGGIKLVGSEYGEIKRMYVRPQFRGLGFAKLMLNHLADYAHAHRNPRAVEAPAFKHGGKAQGNLFPVKYLGTSY
jgi:GNAT superfamily N-acetyltransferase